jgi:hypothetical protein
MFGSGVIQPGHITGQVQRPRRHAKAFSSDKEREFIALSWEEDPQRNLQDTQYSISHPRTLYYAAHLMF